MPSVALAKEGRFTGLSRKQSGRYQYTDNERAAFCNMVDLLSDQLYHKNMKKNRHKVSSYFAVFDPAEEGGYNVSFPDFPGCVTFGRNFEEAKRMAAEILELWLEELADQRREIPVKAARPIIDEVRVAIPA